MKKTAIGLMAIMVLGVLLLSGCTSKWQGQTCTSTDGMHSNCKDGLLCNVGSGSTRGVCNTVQQCINSGSTAEAFEGNEVCFMGV